MRAERLSSVVRDDYDGIYLIRAVGTEYISLKYVRCIFLSILVYKVHMKN